jgi:type IV secretion system protein VirB6
MAAFDFYQTTMAHLDVVLTTYVHTTAANVVGAIGGVAATMLTIYVVLWGVGMLRGMIAEPLMDGAIRIVRLAVILGLCINLGRYEGAISNNLFAMPDALAGVVTGVAPGSSASFLDTLMGQIYDFGLQYHDAAEANSSTVGNIPDLTLMLCAGLIWCTGLVLTAYGAFLLVLSKIGLGVVLAIGPIFILLTMFDATKRFFDAWLGQVVNFILMVTLTAATLRVILQILVAYLTSAGPAIDGLPGPTQAIPALAIGAIGILVLLQVPSLASALAGGVALNTLGAAGAAFSRARAGVTAMRPTNVRRSMNQMRSDARIVGGFVSGAAGGTRSLVTDGVGGRAAAGLARTAGPVSTAAGYAAGRGVAAPMAVYRKITSGRTNRVSRA